MSETADEKKKRRPGAPRILIAGTGSGCGKTTLTCGILYGFVGQGYSPTAYKCGPDYIDSMFHSRVIGKKTVQVTGFYPKHPAVEHGINIIRPAFIGGRTVSLSDKAV